MVAAAEFSLVCNRLQLSGTDSFILLIEGEGIDLSLITTKQKQVLSTPKDFPNTSWNYQNQFLLSLAFIEKNYENFLT